MPLIGYQHTYHPLPSRLGSYLVLTIYEAFPGRDNMKELNEPVIAALKYLR
jgi:hypothetical protein